MLSLHEFHRERGAHFASLNGLEIVADYGERAAEHAALRERAGVMDLGFRGRPDTSGLGGTATKTATTRRTTMISSLSRS